MMSFDFSSTNIENKEFIRSPVVPRLCVTDGIEIETADDTPSRHDTASRHDTTSRLGGTDHRIISPDLNTEHKSCTPVSSTTAATSAVPSVHTDHSRGTKVGTVSLHLVPIVSLVMDGKERLCLAQISNTLLKNYSYNEIHNRRVALGITCVQCTPVQLEILRRAGAMPASSRRCGMITKREAERLVKSFLDDITPPKLPEDFVFQVEHDCGWGCRGCFLPARYNSSRAKCIRCCYCDVFFSPNKFIFHFHRSASSKYNHPDAANFNSWRRHLKLAEGHNHGEAVLHAWEDVKAMFNGGNRRRLQPTSSAIPGSSSRPHHQHYRRQDADFQKLNQHPVLKKPSNSYGKSDATCSISSSNNGCRGRSIGHLLPSPSLPVSQSIYPQMDGQCSPPVLNYCQAATTDFIAARSFNFRSAACTGIPCSDYVTSECDVIKRSGSPIKIDAGFFSGKRQFLTSIDDNDVDDTENKEFLARQTVQFMTEKENMADEDDETEGDYDDTNQASISDYNYDRNRDSECESIDVDTVDDDNCVAAIQSAEELKKSTDETLYNNLEDTMTCPDELHEETRHSEEHRSGFQYKMSLLEAPVQAVDLVSSSSNDNSYRCREPDSSGQSIAGNMFVGTMEERRDPTKESFQGQQLEPERSYESPPQETEQGTREDLDQGTPEKHDHQEVPVNDWASCTEEQLRLELSEEFKARRKLENDYSQLKEKLAEEIEKERRMKMEIDRQFQHVKGVLCQELSQERKSRLTLQQQLQEAREAVHNLSYNLLLHSPSNGQYHAPYHVYNDGGQGQGLQLPSRSHLFHPSISLLSNLNAALSRQNNLN